MCGLIGMVLHPAATAPGAGPSADALLAAARSAAAGLRAADGASVPAGAAFLGALDAAEALGRRLVCYTGFRAVATTPTLAAAIAELADVATAAADALPGDDDGDEAHARAELDGRLRDVAWRIREDVLAQVPRVNALAGLRASAPPVGDPLLRELWRLDVTLQNLGRLEVRGRDSSGLSILVHLETDASRRAFDDAIAAAGLGAELTRRESLHDFVTGAIVRGPSGVDGASGSALAFTHKVAREVGELGQNVADLRAAVAADGVLRAALAAATTVDAFGHTRWASNGVISQPNAHPLNQVTVPASLSAMPSGRFRAVARPIASASEGPLVLAALNGDVDNYLELHEGLRGRTGRGASPRITTDAKLIPMLIAEQLPQAIAARATAGGAGGDDDPVLAAIGDSVGLFEGSTAIAVQSSIAPGRTYLALRGSGQAIHVGLTDEGVIYASELYGVVERTDRQFQLDGRDGEIVVLDASAPPPAPGAAPDGGDRPLVTSRRWDGGRGAIGAERVSTAEITTRDIDRAGFPHFLLKEIRESPRSVARTLRGKLGAERVVLGEEAVPAELEALIARRALRRVFVIGQGTAAVAGKGIAAVLSRDLSPAGVAVEGVLATELSGFRLDEVGPGCLVVAVSQSGTTTDTNRAVDLARDRGAVVVGIVNRRGSDLTTKAQGTLYTSDGRDVEMSVASTKAFYCQVVAGALLSLWLAERVGSLDEAKVAARVAGLRGLPELLSATLDAADEPVREIALQLAPRRRYYAVIGSGAAAVAAHEVRIKVSELCYRSVAVDSVEDKKHIDLSAEPLIVMCAAGLGGSALADAVKEASIFRAHRAAPIVIADASAAARFEPYASGFVGVPSPVDAVAEILVNTAAGHLFAYWAARAIDEGSVLLRRMREHVEEALDGDEAIADPSAALGAVRAELVPLVRELDERIRDGRYRAALEPDTAVALALLTRYALGRIPLIDLEADTGVRGGLTEVFEALRAALTVAIDETRRTIDAVKHQAKTVTVGTSRAAEPIEGSLGEEAAAAGVGPAEIAPRDAEALAALAGVIESVDGSTTYDVSGLDALGNPADASRLVVRGKRGVAASMRSRADEGAALTGNKRVVVRDRRLFLGVGGKDGRTLAIVPILERGVPRGILLLHLTPRHRVARPALVRALRAVGDRYDDLRAAVGERDVPWDDALLDEVGPAAALLDPVERVADSLAAAAAGP